MIVGLNRFPSDTDKEISHTLSWIEQKLKCKCFLTEPYTKGGKGCLDIAEEIINTQGQTEQKFHYLYPLKLNPQEKIKTIAKKIYRAREVEFSKKALKDLERIESFGFSRLPARRKFLSTLGHFRAANQFALLDARSLLRDLERYLPSPSQALI